MSKVEDSKPIINKSTTDHNPIIPEIDYSKGITVSCVNQNTSTSQTIIGQILDFTKKLLLGVLIIISIIFIIGCLIFLMSGPQAFDDYWRSNSNVIKLIITASEKTVDHVVPVAGGG
jgi:hypothetical protein